MSEDKTPAQAEDKDSGQSATGSAVSKPSASKKASVKKAASRKAASRKAAPKKAASKKTAADKAEDGNAAATAQAAEPELRIKSAAALEKAAASKEADLKQAARKISELSRQKADEAIRSRSGRDDLKARAAEAKRRAQEKILEKSFVSDPPEDPLERLANTFDNSARRWEMVVYPSLFAFVLLAGYGFFLIYRLTHDIATLSQSVTHMAVIVSDAMPRMTRDLNTMTDSMDNMTGNIAGMTSEIESMSGQMDSLTPMSKNIQSMTHNIGSMNRSVYGMQRDMHGMNRTVSSGPFGMMNDMMPFSSSTNVPPPLPQPPVWPSYSAQPYQQPYHPYRQSSPAARQADNGMRAAQGTEKKTPAPEVGGDNSADPAKQISLPGASPVVVKEAATP